MVQHVSSMSNESRSGGFFVFRCFRDAFVVSSSSSLPGGGQTKWGGTSDRFSDDCRSLSNEEKEEDRSLCLFRLLLC